jgi:hypothetical protein
VVAGGCGSFAVPSFHPVKRLALRLLRRTITPTTRGVTGLAAEVPPFTVPIRMRVSG